jgi:hypothetical protein
MTDKGTMKTTETGKRHQFPTLHVKPLVAVNGLVLTFLTPLTRASGTHPRSRTQNTRVSGPHERSLTPTTSRTATPPPSQRLELLVSSYGT